MRAASEMLSVRKKYPDVLREAREEISWGKHPRKRDSAATANQRQPRSPQSPAENHCGVSGTLVRAPQVCSEWFCPMLGTCRSGLMKMTMPIG